MKAMAWAGGLALLALVGCGSTEAPESKASADHAAEAAAQWSPEQKEAYKKAMAGHAVTRESLQKGAQPKVKDSKSGD